MFQPLDVIKTRMIVQYAENHPSQTKGMFQMIQKVVREESISGLWRGTTPAVVRVVPGAGIYFTMLHSVSSKLRPKSLAPTSPLPAQYAAISGIVARSSAAVALCPISVIKTRMEATHVSSQAYQSLFGGLSHVIKTDGILGLYRGLLPTLIRDAPYAALYFMTYDRTRAWFHSHIQSDASYLQPLVCGAFSGGFATLCTHPPDVIRTRIQAFQRTPSKGYAGMSLSIAKVIQHICATDGIKGLFTGIAPRVTRRSLSSAVTWMTFEEVVKALK